MWTRMREEGMTYAGDDDHAEERRHAARDGVQYDPAAVLSASSTPNKPGSHSHRQACIRSPAATAAARRACAHRTAAVVTSPVRAAVACGVVCDERSEHVPRRDGAPFQNRRVDHLEGRVEQRGVVRAVGRCVDRAKLVLNQAARGRSRQEEETLISM